MTTTFSNLTPGLSRDDKLRTYKRIRVKHPRISQLFAETDLLLAPCSGADIVLFIGPTGVGKTTATTAMLENTYQEQAGAMALDATYIPAVQIEAPSAGERAFSWRLLYGSMLEALNEPLIDRKLDTTATVSAQLKTRTGIDSKMLSGLRQSVEHALKERRTRYVIIDEAVHILRQAGPRELPVYMDTLKSLSNICDVTFVLVGSYDLFDIMSLSGQLARRTHTVHFTRYRRDVAADYAAFKKTAGKLVEHMPVEGEVDLERWLDPLFERSIGCVGILKDMLQRAVTLTLINGGVWKDEYLRRALLNKQQTRIILEETLKGEKLLDGCGPDIAEAA